VLMLLLGTGNARLATCVSQRIKGFTGPWRSRPGTVAAGSAAPWLNRRPPLRGLAPATCCFMANGDISAHRPSCANACPVVGGLTFCLLKRLRNDEGSERADLSRHGRQARLFSCLRDPRSRRRLQSGASSRHWALRPGAHSSCLGAPTGCAFCPGFRFRLYVPARPVGKEVYLLARLVSRNV
jgi:hypothetical protein